MIYASLLKRMSVDLLIPARDIESIVKTAPRRYKVYQIRKRKPGEFRTIAQPSSEVKLFQHWIMKNILSSFPVHSAATAYREGLNIRDNAAAHANHRYLLKLDFRDFFNSIRSVDFLLYLGRKNVDFDPQVCEALVRVLFWKPRGSSDLILSIGAPSSPMLSNILLFDFDTQLHSLCVNAEVTYTRYADDISLSTDRPGVLGRLYEEIGSLCATLESPRLRLNREKTVHASRKARRFVTGLILTNEGEVSLGRSRKREISATVHRFASGMLDKKAAASLTGMLSFAKSVDPRFIDALHRKYGPKVLGALGFHTP